MDEFDTAEENLGDPNFHLRKLWVELAAEVCNLGEYLEDLEQELDRKRDEIANLQSIYKATGAQKTAIERMLEALPREIV